MKPKRVGKFGLRLEISLKWVSLVAAFLIGGIQTAAFAKEPVRIYGGNLSVGYFREYWETAKRGEGDIATPEYCERIKGLSMSAFTDYIGWCQVEREAGKWDWSFYDENEKTLHANGLQYVPFSWIHFAPEWYRKTADYVPYRCGEHNMAVQMTSLWAPGTLKSYDRFYKELADHFGDKIDFIRLALPADYGEAGYPAGYTTWLVKQEHVHPGFWCNDPYARADFKAYIKEKYSSIAQANSTWGSSFPSFDEIEFPEIAKNPAAFQEPLDMTLEDRRKVLDFIEWYYESQVRFARKAIEICRKYFPKKEIVISLGHGSQRTWYGNDDVGLTKLLGETNVSCQAPGNIPYFYMKNIASPCHFYGVPYYTEPPEGNMKPEEVVKRLWSDASCGVQTYFDYPENLTRGKEQFDKYKFLLDGQVPKPGLAIFFPTTEHRLRNQDWPAETAKQAESLRDYLDYDLVDERMIYQGALSSYQILLMCEGSVVETETLMSLESWVSRGGTLVIRDFGLIETVEKERDFFKRVVPRMNIVMLDQSFTVKELVKGNGRKLGKGVVIKIPKGPEADVSRVVSELAHQLSKHTAGNSLPLIDDYPDQVLATLFADRIIYFNPTETPVEKTLLLRKEDFGKKQKRPKLFEYHLKLEPFSMEQVELN